MTTVRDEDFPLPIQINALDCVTSDRYLHKVNESVTINNVCQDPNNPSLVIINFSLVGAFLFTPFCKILSVDGDTSYQINDISPPLALGHYRNVDIPIDTHCETVHKELVFDFGKVIPNFLSAQSIKFMLGMIGTIPISFGINFPNQTPTTEFTWNKGVLPRPIGLTYSNGSIKVLFEYNGDKDCSCNIQCFVPSGVSHSITFCPNDIQTVSVAASLTGSPFDFNITLQDSIGNQSNLNVFTVHNVIPQPPLASMQQRPLRIEVAISNLSLDAKDLAEADYQIIKYVGTPTNHFIWKDWSERAWSYFIDRDVIPGSTYGYAVRYKGKFGDKSLLSSWTVVNT